ncbi:hypothetical protein B0T16DRAFT_453218 [Cercophora newfieldiana]|uniref:Uncharacterized protein n=1 Tax=Cercophora newfieldiana TaxID=92897 RepID=A0AA40D102_9PEZI|nr:hypothetical protein B0T16DRAFT_453218 [Cercophora newfieldiana]
MSQSRLAGGSASGRFSLRKKIGSAFRRVVGAEYRNSASSRLAVWRSAPEPVPDIAIDTPVSTAPQISLDDFPPSLEIDLQRFVTKSLVPERTRQASETTIAPSSHRSASDSSISTSSSAPWNSGLSRRSLRSTERSVFFKSGSRDNDRYSIQNWRKLVPVADQELPPPGVVTACSSSSTLVDPDEDMSFVDPASLDVEGNEDMSYIEVPGSLYQVDAPPQSLVYENPTSEPEAREIADEEISAFQIATDEDLNGLGQVQKVALDVSDSELHNISSAADLADHNLTLVGEIEDAELSLTSEFTLTSSIGNDLEEYINGSDDDFFAGFSQSEEMEQAIPYDEFVITPEFVQDLEDYVNESDDEGAATLGITRDNCQTT